MTLNPQAIGDVKLELYHFEDNNLVAEVIDVEAHRKAELEFDKFVPDDLAKQLYRSEVDLMIGCKAIPVKGLGVNADADVVLKLYEKKTSESLKNSKTILETSGSSEEWSMFKKEKVAWSKLAGSKLVKCFVVDFFFEEKQLLKVEAYFCNPGQKEEYFGRQVSH